VTVLSPFSLVFGLWSFKVMHKACTKKEHLRMFKHFFEREVAILWSEIVFSIAHACAMLTHVHTHRDTQTHVHSYTYTFMHT
jgi:hypothetical protein